MARSRNIKPGFFRNADLVELPVEARLLFIGLWTIADREGRLKDRPKQIKMDIFPADNVDCNSLVQMIADAGMLVRYEHGGNRYLQIINFNKHQNPHKDEQESTIPAQCEEKPQAPCMHGACTEVARLNPEPLIPDSLIKHAACGQLSNPKPPDAPPTVFTVPIDGGQKEIFDDGHATCVAVSAALKANGVNHISPANPQLNALVTRGADIGQFLEAAHKARAKGKGLAYLMGIVQGQLNDAQGLTTQAMAMAAGTALTMPARRGKDPALAKLEADRLVTGPPPAHIRALLANLSKTFTLGARA